MQLYRSPHTHLMSMKLDLKLKSSLITNHRPTSYEDAFEDEEDECVLDGTTLRCATLHSDEETASNPFGNGL